MTGSVVDGRECEIKATTLPWCTFYTDLTTQFCDNPLNNGQSQTVPRRANLVQASELCEKLCLLALGQPRTVILDPKSHPHSIVIWIIVPVSTLGVGALAWRLKTMSASMEAHAMINASGYRIGTIIATLRM
jgi:hypothetical protein